jgi:hypothetical protein
MTHLTSKERTGFTAKDIKIHKVLTKLQLEMTLDDTITGKKDNKIYKINRKELIESIQGALGLVSMPTVYAMISYLLTKGYIKNNFNTQFSAIKGIIMPTSNTLYELTPELINSYLGKCFDTPLIRSLDSFNKP